MVRQPAGSVDFFPTVCGLAGIAGAREPGWPRPRPVLFENRAFERDLFWRTGRAEAYLLGNWKYIRTREGDEYLFDLERDPRETTNRAADAAALGKIKAALEV